MYRKKDFIKLLAASGLRNAVFLKSGNGKISRKSRVTKQETLGVLSEK